MKKITLMWSLLFCMAFTMTAQSVQLSDIERELLQASTMEEQTPSVTIQELLVRLENLGDQANLVDNAFNAVERQMLKAHFRNQNRSSLVDIIPTAGATETFLVAVGDHFFDPGGPGGSSTGGTPGNYPNCGCVTLTTLDGATEIDFLFFSVFATFDWLRIYDSADTSGPVLYDNSAGGANDGDITLADMIASAGSSVFTGTSGFMTFEFNATAVVDYGGWDVEILSAGGGGPVTAYGPENVNAMFSSFDTSAPDALTAIGPIGTTSFENAGALNAAGDTAYVLGSDGDFWSVDVASGVYTPLGAILPPNGGTWAAMEMDLTTGTLYGLSGNFAADNTLNTIDIAGVSATALPNNVGMPGGGIGLAIDGAGAIWAYDLIDDNLYSIDGTTGIGAIVGNIGFDANFGQGMGYDPNTGTVYMSAFNGAAFQSEWRSVDTSNGNTTFIGVMGSTTPGGLTQIAWVSMVNNIPPVDNDLCADATPIACGETLSGDTSDGNTDTNGAQDPNLLSPDEWFAFTSTQVGEIVTVSTCNQAGYDTRLSVWEDCTLANQIAENDDTAGCAGFTTELQFQGDGSSTYYIAVDGFSGASGAFDLTITCELGPVNDTCPGALAMKCGDTVVGETNTAFFDAGAPVCNTDITAPGVWYVFRDTTGLVTDYTLSMCDGGTDYDSKITVYTGDCAALVCVTDNDDTCGLQSEVMFQGDGLTTYYILVHGFGSSTGNFSMELTCVPIPPPNDMIANSIDVDEIGFPYTDPAVPMPAATTENGTPAGCDNAGAKGVWYNFVPDGDGFATASITTPGGASTNFSVNNGPLAGNYVALQGDFGGALPNPNTPLTEDTALVLDDDTTGDENDACDPILNGASLAGKIAVVRRGSCQFGFKALSAQNEGAIAVIVVNNVPDPIFVMGGGDDGDAVTIPVVMVNDVDGEAIISELEGGGTVNVSISSTPAGLSHVSFYTAPDENAIETDLTLVPWNGNQCVPGISAIIPTVAGQAYYVYVTNGAITDIVIDGNNLGADDNAIQGFTYYPNPTDGVLNLNSIENIDDVAIYNLLGQQVLNQTIRATSVELNVSNLTVGAYIMKVSVNGQIGTYKIIKR